MSQSEISENQLEPSMQRYEDELNDLNEVLNDKTPSNISQSKSVSILKSKKKKSETNINSMMQNLSE